MRFWLCEEIALGEMGSGQVNFLIEGTSESIKELLKQGRNAGRREVE